MCHIPQYYLFFYVNGFKSRCPFSWKNPIGYIFAAAIQYVAATYICLFVACALFFGIANFAIIMKTSTDTKDVLDVINESAKTKENRSQTLAHLSDFIKIYSAQKQLRTQLIPCICF